MPFIELPSIHLHYLEEGTGSPMLWLPGGNDSAALMLYSHRSLAARLRLICLDPRGQGESEAPQTADGYAPPEHVTDMLGVIDSLGIDRAIIGGHSRGGRTSVEFALAHPDRVVAVIAAASPLLGQTAARGDGFRRYQRVLAEEGVDAFLEMLRSGPRNPERRALWVAAAHRAGATALIAQYEALGRLGPLTERLRSLSVPALFLTGNQDFLKEHARTAAGASSAIRMAVIPNAGHALFVDNPGDYFATLNAFLDDVLERADRPRRRFLGKSRARPPVE